ncbi:hypothetical protein DL98DRAFT_577424 [Cadophora sp. DSE1049]|nr:hypothetical protein DL98DRAFT_577424 [Cadophora sp. DSE1049]
MDGRAASLGSGKVVADVCLSENSTENTGGHLRPPSPAGSDNLGSSIISEDSKPKPHQANIFSNDYRRVDFHWLVRDRNYLLWISDLLNDVSRSQEWHRENQAGSQVDIRINTHVTAV